jgi:hypothetical protein
MDYIPDLSPLAVPHERLIHFNREAELKVLLGLPELVQRIGRAHVSIRRLALPLERFSHFNLDADLAVLVSITESNTSSVHVHFSEISPTHKRTVGRAPV